MLTVSHTTKSFPSLPYEEMKDAILGKKYSLSLAFIGEKRAQALNKAHRNATYVPNVLSFPLQKDAGEIFITPVVAEREAPKYSLTKKGYIGYLFIHGLLHLKGYPHGATMEKAEKKFMELFKMK
ncbi:MAG: rRNA maturation RNase YbeY [Minisyncoccia bacterium]